MFSATDKYYSWYVLFPAKFALILSIFSVLLIFPPVLHAGQQMQDDNFDEALRLFYLKEYDDAYSILVRITEEACNETEKADLCVQAKTTRANIYRNRRDFSSAEDIIDKALSVSNASDTVDESSFINIYIQKSYLLLETSEMQEAFKWAEQALIYTEEYGIQGLIRARALLLRGRLFHGDGKFSEAVTDYTVAQEILESSERTLEVITMLTQLHNNIGISYRRLGRVNLAMEHYQTNLSLVRETFGENHLELGYAYNSIGTVYYTIGDYATAGGYFERSASVFRSYLGENSSRYLAALNNAGFVYTRLGDLTTAANVLERAQRLKENTLGRDHPETAIGYLGLANIYSQNDEFEKARQNYQLAISVFTAHYGENHPNLVAPHIQLGDFYTVTNQYDLSRQYYNQAIEIIQTRIGSSHPDIWDVTRKIGNSYMMEERLDEAITYFSNSIQLIKEDSGFSIVEQVEFDAISHPVEFLFALKGMADVHLMKFRQDNNPDYLDIAQFHYELAADIVEYLQTKYQSEASKLSLLEENYGIFSNTIELFYYRYEISTDESWLEKMFEWSERSRSRIAIELLQDLDARNFAGVPQDILDEERQLNQVITDLYRSLHREQERGFDSDESVTSAYRDSLFYAKQQLQDFTRQLETNYPSYFFLRYDTNPATLSLAQSLLTEDETLISYLFTEDKLFALLIDQSGISAVDLGINSDIPDRIELIRNTVLSGQTAQFSDTSIRLYEKLIAPLIDKISTNRLIIVPDQSLHFLPFELLLTGSDAARYHQMPFLIRDYMISYTPSVSVLQRMQERRSENPRNLLAMAPFNQSIAEFNIAGDVERYAGNLSPLPLTRYETSEISKLFRQRRAFMDFFFPQKTDVFLHTDASKELLTSTSLQDYSYIHFATHAFVNELNPEFSGIVLWGEDDNPDSGIVYVADIYNLNMNADLVVLGACETGLGTMYRGEGLIGFTRAFIYAGAANLLVSKWRVSDQPTSKLMIHFYEFMKDGFSYSEALQLAKLELIDHPEYAAPVNWAAFILQGR